MSDGVGAGEGHFLFTRFLGASQLSHEPPLGSAGQDRGVCDLAARRPSQWCLLAPTVVFSLPATSAQPWGNGRGGRRCPFLERSCFSPSDAPGHSAGAPLAAPLPPLLREPQWGHTAPVAAFPPCASAPTADARRGDVSGTRACGAGASPLTYPRPACARMLTSLLILCHFSVFYHIEFTDHLALLVCS